MSDFGVRAVSAAGIVFNYKRLLATPAAPMHVAVMPGLGLLHLGEHAHLETTLLASRRDVGRDSASRRESPLVPYGGLRVMQAIPLRGGALHDEAVVGAFLGMRVGTARMGISPEIGVFYDRSAMKLRRSNIVIVPAVVVHGDELMDMLGGRSRGGRPPWR